jgi:ribonuclease VapC
VSPAYVLDASAILASLYGEDGHDQVDACLDGAVASTVNWAEAATKLVREGHPNPARAMGGLRTLGVRVLPLSADDAITAGRLYAVTKSAGLSLGDRCCLAVTAGLGGIALTADRPWADLDLGPDITVQLIR